MARVNLQYQGEAGVVPEFEAREAAVYVHLTWAAFLALDRDERAKVLAHYRLHNLIEQHIGYETMRKHSAPDL